MRKNAVILILLVQLISCTDNHQSTLSSFEVFCEMVASDAKPVALSYPMTNSEAEKLQSEFEKIAEKYEVKLYREKSFPVTLLFPEAITKDKEVYVIYREPRLVQYQQLKKDIENSKNQDFRERMQLARRMGRLLGYSPPGINQLLMKNSDFRTLRSHGVVHQVSHFYYDNLDDAVSFYRNTLGLQETDSLVFKIGEDASIRLHANNEKHPAKQPKSTAIALLTDQLQEWYQFIQEKDIPVKYPFKPREGGPHDGFVAIDPGGYLLEFEKFKQHPENELFMAILENTPRINTTINSLNFYGSVTWTYHRDLLKMQNFYENELGFRMVADQGWVKIYQTSPSGFIGLVDERRGMMDYADEKAIEIEWQIENKKDFEEFLKRKFEWCRFGKEFQGPERYMYLIR